MKRIITLLLIFVVLLSACSNASEVQPEIEIVEPVENVTEPAVEPEEVKVVEEPVEIIIPETQVISLGFKEKQTIQHQGTEFSFEIISVGQNDARLTITTPDGTDTITVREGKKSRLYDDLYLYVSSLSIISFPSEDVDALIVIDEFEDDVFIIDESDVIEVEDDVSIEVELDGFTGNKVSIEFETLQLEDDLLVGKESVVGPFTISPIAVDSQSKVLIAQITYDEDIGLTYQITREETEVYFDDDTYDFSFLNSYLDTRKEQPIQIEISLNGKKYELGFNEPVEIKDMTVTVTELYTEEDSREDWILVKVE